MPGDTTRNDQQAQRRLDRAAFVVAVYAFFCLTDMAISLGVGAPRGGFYTIMLLVLAVYLFKRRPIAWGGVWVLLVIFGASVVAMIGVAGLRDTVPLHILGEYKGHVLGWTLLPVVAFCLPLIYALAVVVTPPVSQWIRSNRDGRRDLTTPDKARLWLTVALGVSVAIVVNAGAFVIERAIPARCT